MDLVSFAKIVCKTILTPLEGTINELYPFQLDYLKTLEEKRFVHAVHSRQMGVTTLQTIYAAWLILYNPDYTLLWMDNRMTMATKSVDKIRRIVKFFTLTQPTTLSIVDEHKRLLRLSNGSRLIASSATPDAGLGRRLNGIIIDNGCYIRNLSDIHEALMVCLYGNDSRSVISSSSDGTISYFNRMGLNPSMYEKVRLHYTVHPRSTPEWIAAMKSLLSPENWQSEMELEIRLVKPEPKDRTFSFRMKAEYVPAFTEMLLERDVSLTDYIMGLIKKDLEV